MRKWKEMLQLSGAGKRFGTKLLFEDVNWLITPDERTGLVGGNGTGKSTLLKILAGIESVDYGAISRTKGMTLGYLPQDGLAMRGKTVFEECLSVFDELRNMEAEAEILTGSLSDLKPGSPAYQVAADRYSHIMDVLHTHDIYTLDYQVGTVLGGLGFAARFARLPAGCDAMLALAALGVLVMEDAARLREKLRLSNEEHARLMGAARVRECLHGAEGPPPPGALRVLLFEQGRQAARDGLALIEVEAAPNAAFAAAQDFLRDTPMPRLPFSGADLSARGLRAGRIMGETLKVLQGRWIRAGFPREPAALARLLDEVTQEVARG